MVPSIWGYDRESSSSPPPSSSSLTRTSQKPYNIESRNFVIRYISIFRRDCTYLKLGEVVTNPAPMHLEWSKNTNVQWLSFVGRVWR